MPDERSIETAEEARRRLERESSSSSEAEFAHERDERHELDLVRQELRRHDRELKENGSS
jgi:hypothetical protein